MRRYSFPAPVVLVLALIFPTACLTLVHAEEDPLADLGAGDLLWRSPQGLVPLPVLGSEVALTVTGPLVRANLTQRFVNGTGQTIEALYAFPLPERAAVDGLEVQVGDRRIVGVVKEKEEAKKTYEAAKTEGKTAALVQQRRANLFTTAVAHVLPGESVEVRLTWLQEVVAQDGRFALAVPLTSTPRCSAQSTERTEPVPASFVSTRGPAFPTASVSIDFTPGTPAADIASPSHRLRLEGLRATTGQVPADRDVVITWHLPEKASPTGTLFVEDREDGSRYGLLLLAPPAGKGEVGLPTRTLFVVDISGSMAGPPLQQAKEALLRALDRLRPYDELALIRFDDASDALWETFHPAASGDLDTARRWVEALATRGGTDIEGALRHAMKLTAAHPSGTPTRIVLVTDGAVDDEAEVVAEIARSLGSARLHVLGIGSAPNRALVRKVAQFGRGTCAFVDRIDRVAEETDRFLDRLERPALTDLEIAWSGTPPLDIKPWPIPDLYVGQTLALSLRLSPETLPGAPTLRGREGVEDVTLALPAPVTAQAGSGVATRWARAAVEGALDALASGADAAEVRQEVVALGTAFSIVTPYTSFVAVDVTPRAAGVTPSSIQLAQGMPAGTLPQGGTDGPLRVLLASILALAGLLAWRLSR